MKNATDAQDLVDVSEFLQSLTIFLGLPGLGSLLAGKDFRP